MKKNFNDFYEIMKILRSPNGCPWDREQTHISLAKHLLEEAYEAYDAIVEEDYEHTREELGDVLMQIVMHAQIAEDNGEYTFEDITDTVSQKMIDRHPHVFSDTVADTSEKVLDNWEQIKRKERGQKKLSEALEDITRSLPALSKAEKFVTKTKRENKLDYPENKYLRPDVEITGDNLGECLYEICIAANAKNLDPEANLNAFLKKIVKNLKNIEENP